MIKKDQAIAQEIYQFIKCKRKVLLVISAIVLIGPSKSQPSQKQQGAESVELQQNSNSFSYMVDINDDDSGVFYDVLVGNEDSRVLVQDTFSYPANVIGEIGQDRSCTGTVVGPRHVLTAAHCIVQVGTTTYHQDLNFYPARNGMELPYGKFDWIIAYVPEEWLIHYSDEYDYGIIVYLQRIDTIISQSYLPYTPECDRTTFKLNLLGYPGDKQPSHTMWYTNCTNIQFECNDSTMVHTCDTSNGMSGGPLFVYRTSTQLSKQGGRTNLEQGWREGEYYSIRGVHLGGNLITRQNRAVVITEQVKENLDAWIQATSF